MGLNRVDSEADIDAERFLRELQQMAEAMAGINRFTEENFLRLGKLIRDSHNRAHSLGRHRSSCTTLDLVEQTIVHESLEQIENCFGELVAALQFQDIARQRLEHVQTNLSNLDQQVARWQAPDSHFPFDICGSVCALQEHQLQTTAVEFGRAASELRTNINKMGTSLERLETALAGELPAERELHAELLAIAANFDLSKQFDALVTPIRDQLAGFAKWSSSGINASKISIDSLFQQLEQSYTMSKERRVHRRFVTGDDEQQQSVSEQDDQLGKPHDLGENVDLF
ncbi:MAG: hypothetical protein C0614_05230 [Desulfuromonas sp.]|nr:MAG: hypothetical protein C0614_05230 [Desulfuromonas sp.]